MRAGSRYPPDGVWGIIKGRGGSWGELLTSPSSLAAASISSIGSQPNAELALDAHSISPWGTWEWIGPPALGAVLPARGMAKLAFDVTPPAWLEPGQWWALVRVGCAGQLVYSPAVKVSVT